MAVVGRRRLAGGRGKPTPAMNATLMFLRHHVEVFCRSLAVIQGVVKED